MNEREAIRKMLRENPALAQTMRKAIFAGKLKAWEEADAKQEQIIVAGPDPCDVDGAKYVSCSGCELRVWISPSTQEIMTKMDRDPTIVCMNCCKLMMAGIES